MWEYEAIKSKVNVSSTQTGKKWEFATTIDIKMKCMLYRRLICHRICSNESLIFHKTFNDIIEPSVE